MDELLWGPQDRPIYRASTEREDTTALHGVSATDGLDDGVRRC